MSSSNGLARKTVALAVAVLAACSKSGGDNLAADSSDPVKVALGSKIYTQHCSACHGTRLEGQPNWRARGPNGRLPAPPHDESGHTWHHPDRVLFGMIKNGLVPPYAPAGYETDMPAFGTKLSDEDIWAVLAYIESHWTSRELLATRAEMIGNEGKR